MALALLVAFMSLSNTTPATATGGTISSPDPGGNTGRFTSLELDAAGNPVVSYMQFPNTLKVLHCGNPTCTVGNTLFAENLPGPLAFENTSLVLDAGGNPAVTFGVDVGFPGYGELRILRCGDPACAAANTISALDATGHFTVASSLALDAANRPVVSYIGLTGTSSFLKLLRCGNPACTAASTETDVDFSGVPDTSMVLDSSGNPVIGHNSLSVAHCGDPVCGSGNTITNPASGHIPSLVLDASGNPVVSYGSSSNLGVLHCGNPSCSAGNTTSIADSGLGPSSLIESSIALDAAGNPVVSYHADDGGNLKLLHCNDPSCAGGDESIASPDTAGVVGEHSSLELDASGYPVVSYYDATNGDLRILHCTDPNCSGVKVAPTPKPTNTPAPAGPLDFSIGVDTDGNGNDDCGTVPSLPATCYLSPGSSFLVKFYVNSLGSIQTYDGYDARLDYAGVTTMKMIDFSPWPQCDIPVFASPTGGVAFACASFNQPSNYAGLLARIKFTCAASGTVSIRHGPFNTALATGLNPHPEAISGLEPLTIDCTATPTPTPTPTRTPTPQPPVGGLSYDISPTTSALDGRQALITLLAFAVAIGAISLVAARRLRPGPC